jgi:hypothetical protein
MAHLSQLHAFTQAEQSQLSTYRTAVAAGFYTDTPDERAHRFTSEGLGRLVGYKAAVAVGFYTDQIEADDPEG